MRGHPEDSTTRNQVFGSPKRALVCRLLGSVLRVPRAQKVLAEFEKITGETVRKRVIE
jgi:hypothetical protein